jgi:predicted  nucleic acid-binding Zn-ribbon protein
MEEFKDYHEKRAKMKEIRNHIEENLEHAQIEYEDIYFNWDRAQQAFKSLEVEVKSLTVSLDKARINMEYYEKLLKELNETENNNKK